MMNDIEQLHQLLASLVSFFSDLLTLENKKLDAITANDIKLLEQCMKDEQAFTMKLKGLEIKRKTVQAQCGFEGLALKDIIARTTGENKDRFTQAYNLLKNRTQEVKDAVSRASRQIRLNLHGFERQITAYNSQATVIARRDSEFESKKV